MRELIQNKDFRIALSHAINRQEIIDVVFLGLAQSAARAAQRVPALQRDAGQAIHRVRSGKGQQLLDAICPRRTARAFACAPMASRWASSARWMHPAGAHRRAGDDQKVLGSGAASAWPSKRGELAVLRAQGGQRAGYARSGVGPRRHGRRCSSHAGTSPIANPVQLLCPWALLATPVARKARSRRRRPRSR